ncbi:MAG: hypothetical protein DRQ63_02195 [Gammaproteobacteria bacterium]|nr:MAG: hypothetical protein DRQ63_02195 [Gammaproteobacteria bacterium]
MRLVWLEAGKIMIEEPKPPRFADDEMLIETQNVTEVYDAKYLVAVLLVFVAKGDGNISGSETEQMLGLLSDHFELPSANALELLTRAMNDIAENPDLENLLKELSVILNLAEKEEIALMMLKVVAADGRKDAEEMDKLSTAAQIIDIPADVMHCAYDRYFEETRA